MLKVKSDIEIAREASLKPVGDIAQRLDIPADSIIPYGHTKAKVDLEFIDSQTHPTHTKHLSLIHI